MNKRCTSCDIGAIVENDKGYFCNTCGTEYEQGKERDNITKIFFTLSDYSVFKLFGLNLICLIIIFGFLYLLRLIYGYDIDILYVISYIGINGVFFWSAYKLGSLKCEKLKA